MNKINILFQFRGTWNDIVEYTANITKIQNEHNTIILTTAEIHSYKVHPDKYPSHLLSRLWECILFIQTITTFVQEYSIFEVRIEIYCIHIQTKRMQTDIYLKLLFQT